MENPDLDLNKTDSSGKNNMMVSLVNLTDIGGKIGI